ncbi:MAG: chemotaxis response regulator protein-glutamate methylesterase [Deltaproteobacteria bacterium]|nr:chemotaxis response regulator protein-glutamate methylesterase [Deltaproteobacteria bacterium]
MNEKKISVLIVDDSALVRRCLKEILESDPDIAVMGTASDPYDAADKMRKVAPDVITLDLEMPRMDGLSFLKKLMAQHPVPVVVCSALARQGSQTALKALEYGAVEIITKPKLKSQLLVQESRIAICDAVKAAAQARLKGQIHRGRPNRVPVAQPVCLDSSRIVVVGASTGGTEALRVLLEALPNNSPGIAVVQHMPDQFTGSFARRLDGLCRLSVREASHNDILLPGRVLIAPGNRHMLLKKNGTRFYVALKDGPLVSRHRPSVDVLFRSAARHAGRNALGVLLTGMGADGAQGLLALKQAGAATVAQDESSCVVFGMPKEAIKLNAVDAVLPLEQVGPWIIEQAGGGTVRSHRLDPPRLSPSIPGIGKGDGEGEKSPVCG